VEILEILHKALQINFFLVQMVVQELKTKFGTWEIPWGDINRFQRLSGDINLDYDDSIAGLLYRHSTLQVFIKKTKVW
jgi:hypothetical protein